MKRKLHRGKVVTQGIVYAGEIISGVVRAKKQPLLTAEEEKELARKAKRGDAAAREKLIESNLRLAITLARQYSRRVRHLDADDLISAAFMGLIEAADRFKPAKRTRFSTYATIRIRQKIMLEIKSKESIIRSPIYFVDKTYAHARTVKDLFRELNERPTTKQVAQRMGVKETMVLRIENSSRTIISLDRQARDTDEGEGDALHTCIASQDQMLLEDVFVRKSIRNRCVHMIEGSGLTGMERKIIMMRFGFDEGGVGATLQEIADELGITREYVRQIEAKALAKIKRKHAKELCAMDE